MATTSSGAPGRGVVDLDRDLIEARVRDRHAEALASWGVRKWMAQRRVDREIEAEVGAAERREARRQTQAKRLY